MSSERPMSPARYPAEFEADVTLSDGGTAHVRPIRPDDDERIVAFHGRQSAESIYYRFFSPHPELSEAEVERLVNVDYVDRMAFIALLGDDLIGVARYDRPEGSLAAEAAFFVDDAHHGRGLATILLEYLAEAARQRGLTEFWATVLPDNRRMTGVFRRAGFEVSSRFSDGVIEVTLGLDPTPEAQRAVEERARRAEQRAVKRLLEPASVAVVGAGREPDGLGHQVVRHLLDHEFTGRVHPVHPEADSIAGVPTVRSIGEVDGGVELAVIAVPADAVVGVAEECGRAGVAGIIVISAGFAESGSDGARREEELVAMARRHGMRLLGPNCMGVVNTDPDVRLHATFSPAEPIPGDAAIMSQSGTLGAVIIDQARRVGLGVSSFVSVGNKADVSGNDLLQYWHDDDRTAVVLLYLESFGNPRRFARIARDVATRKPVLAIKAGRALPSDLDDETVDGLFAQHGVVRVEGVARMLDVARILARQPVPSGTRVGIVSNSGGAMSLAVDAGAGAGLDLVATVDLGWSASAADYERALGEVAPDVDAVLAIYAPPNLDGTEAFGHALGITMARHPRTTIIASAFGPHPPMLATAGDRAVPVFDFPDEAMVALGSAAVYGSWRSRSQTLVLDHALDADPIVVRSSQLAAAGDHWLSLDEAAGLLGEVGLDVTSFGLASTPEGAADVADRLGYPVGLKSTELRRPARREVEGVALDLHDRGEVTAAFARMQEATDPAMERAIVQRMLEPGTDLALHVVVHDQLGPVLSIGRGGTRADPSIARRLILPTTDADVVDAVAATGLDLPVDLGGVVDLVARVAALVDAAREIVELHLDPLVVSEGVAAITNAWIRVRPEPEPARPELRRL